MRHGCQATGTRWICRLQVRHTICLSRGRRGQRIDQEPGYGVQRAHFRGADGHR